MFVSRESEWEGGRGGRVGVGVGGVGMTAGESAPQRNFGDSGSVFFLPTVMRPVESPNKHKEPCFGSGHLLLRRHRQRERAAGVGGWRGLKRREQRDRGQRGGQEGMSASSATRVSISILPLHPLPPSCRPPLFPAAGQFLPRRRKTPLMATTAAPVCASRHRLPFVNPAVNSRYICPPHCASTSACKVSFFIVFVLLSSSILRFSSSSSNSRCHSPPRPLWTSLPVRF